jgi:glycerate-2-kinase
MTMAAQPSDEALARARETVRQLFAAALQAVDPARAVRSALAVDDGSISVRGNLWTPGDALRATDAAMGRGTACRAPTTPDQREERGQTLTIEAPAGVHVMAVGKAAVAMTRGALAALDGAIVSGDVITKDGHADGALPERFRVHEAAHPIPDERGVQATTEALQALRALADDVVVLALVSGGGSALLEAPVPGLTWRGQPISSSARELRSTPSMPCARR